MKRYLTRDSNVEAFDTPPCFVDDAIQKLTKFTTVSGDRLQFLERECATLRARLEATEELRLRETQMAEQLHKQELAQLQQNFTNKLEIEHQRHANEIQQAKQRSEAELSTNQIELSVKISTVERLEADLSTQRSEISAKNSKIELLEADLSTQRSEISTKNSKIELFEADLSTQRSEISTKNSKIERLEAELSARQSEIVVKSSEIERLQAESTVGASRSENLESENLLLRRKVAYLESGNKEQSERYAAMERQVKRAESEKADAQAEMELIRGKLREEESHRRKLHNLVQDLKGNVRVVARVRPATIADGSPGKMAQITYPDDGENGRVEIRGHEAKTSVGRDATKVYNYTFDHVFRETSTNDEIFQNLSELIQSSLDGYNVCIFAYGQTGSGKTYTMSSADGMIPQSLRMIYNHVQALAENGWSYTMTGTFVEVYNETLNDLLGGKKAAADDDSNKLEIKHDLEKRETTITNITTVELDSADKVEAMLTKAMANRSVAATKANERSSRSHSVFMLTLVGQNSVTGESCRGTLNLVDLAGSERLNSSKVEGERLKETQSINKSLSSLGDVIAALGQRKGGPAGRDTGHIPYRNSKLTNLLQFSLGGNSKTMMFVMVSPLKDHLQETLTSLNFATKVHNTHIGRATRQ